MSRRLSRVSTDARQNDTLLEFENFKKKFLLANKHITKLNSTLSVRIEELNAQISTLYVENLRLRASEIALVTQLKKEREKSRRVMADAEAAIHNFMKHLGYIRKSHNIPHGRSSTPEPQPQPPRARRPVPNPDASPPMNRIARAPNFPNIHEDDEVNASSPESPEPEMDAESDEADEQSPTPARRKTKPRSSGSRLPLPTRTSSPPPLTLTDVPVIAFDEQLSKAGKRKPTRRQSGLLATSMSITTVTERPPSPAFGSPLRRGAAVEEEEEEVIAVIGGIDGREDDEPGFIAQSITRREKKKKSKSKKREVLAVDSERGSSSESVKRERERRRTQETDELVVAAEVSKKYKLKDVTNSPSTLTPLDTLLSDREWRSTADAVDPPTSATSTVTSSSSTTSRTFLTTPATTPTSSFKPEMHHLPTPRSSSPIPPHDPSDSEQLASAAGRERRARKSVNYAEPKLNTKMRKPDGFVSSLKRPSVPSADGTSAPRTSGEYSVPGDSQPPDEPLPPTIVKRKKSRAYVLPEDGEESEGAQADAEYGGVRVGVGSSADWASAEGRRRSVQSTGNRLKMLEGDDGRRHSMAV